jgi:glyoxylase-like metal-dependent hydrolase (beta-lactamase superfamily II)
MRIGDVTVHSLLDGVIPVPPAFFYPDVPTAVWEQIPGALTPDGMLEVPFGGFLATDLEGNHVLFDLGGGPAPQLLPNGAMPPVLELLPINLDALGYSFESITDIVLSHLHIDHVGWASADGVATFPDARHHIHTLDWEHFVEQGADEAVQAKVLPVQNIVKLWDGDQTKLFPWLTLFHAPGHTPGTSVALIESQGKSLALVGDLLHHPAAIEHPDWRCGQDHDPTAATAHRTEWINRLRASGTPMVGPHFPELTPIVP